MDETITPFEVAAANGALAGYRVGDGPPALVLHGGPFSYRYMDPLVRELATVVDCVAYQQRGLPPSAVGGPYSVRRHVADGLSVLDGLGIERAWMIGHSWGGFLAMAIAAAAPDRVLGYVSIEGTVPVGDSGMEAHEQSIFQRLTDPEVKLIERLDAEPAEDAPVPLHATSVAVYWKGYFPDPSTAPPLPPIEINRACAVQSLEDMIRENERGQIASQLQTLDAFALFILGSESGLRAPAEQFAATLGRARTAVIRGAGHFPWVESPKAIGDLLTSLINWSPPEDA